jgi:DNA-binding Lrp family transcriptional regulator
VFAHLVWIVLAALSANDPDFTRQMTLHQFAKMLNMQMPKVWRIILELEAMGFILGGKSL